jgi:hypothetical protein
MPFFPKAKKETLKQTVRDIVTLKNTAALKGSEVLLVINTIQVLLKSS